MPKIAVYTICKNEEHNIEGWMKCTDNADVRVLADTGSTDNTVELARSLGAIVHEITIDPWRFDMARNAALALVPKDVDVCLIMDLDERVDPTLFDMIRSKWEPKINRGWLWVDNGNLWQMNRLHSRAGYVWKYPCHELAERYIFGEEHHEFFDSVMTSQSDPNKDRSYYSDLLILGVTENPQNARMWTYLARQAVSDQNWEIAKEAGSKALELSTWAPERAHLYFTLSLAADNTGIDPLPFVEKGVDENPNEREPYTYLCSVLVQREEWERIKELTTKALALPVSKHYLMDINTEWELLDFAAIAHYKLGDKEKAIELGRKALECMPGDERLQGNLDYFLEN